MKNISFTGNKKLCNWVITQQRYQGGGSVGLGIKQAKAQTLNLLLQPPFRGEKGERKRNGKRKKYM